LAAGLDLLADRPIDAIAIDELVARAGVAKGSFFNHFGDKPGFARALSGRVRAALEARVTAANAGIEDPVLRLAGGMREAVRFALEERKPAMVMLREVEAMTFDGHPLNIGIVADIQALIGTGHARAEAGEGGVRYWIALCQIAMMSVVAQDCSAAQATQHLRALAVLGLTGLGVPEDRARMAAKWAAAGLSA
jgi:AcrR family transcriptional regulator